MGNLFKQETAWVFSIVVVAITAAWGKVDFDAKWFPWVLCAVGGNGLAFIIFEKLRTKK